MRSLKTACTGTALLAVLLAVPALAAEPVVINLTQIPCQFLESENGVDQGFRSRSSADCRTINKKTGKARLEKARVLKLKPGKYIFRVTNKNVPYSLGFWLREHDYSLGNPLHKLTKTSVSGGGLKTGVTKDYEVELEAGKKYLYSCPLNPTPDYRIEVN